jgi:hypothetical protein
MTMLRRGLILLEGEGGNSPRGRDGVKAPDRQAQGQGVLLSPTGFEDRLLGLGRESAGFEPGAG